MSVSVVLPYMFRSLSLTILRGCSKHNKTGSREVHTTTTQIESTATCPDKVVTKATRRRVALQQEQPVKMVKNSDRNMQGRTTDTDILMFQRSDCVFNVYFKLQCMSWILNNVSSNMFRCNYHHQGANYSILLKVAFVKIKNETLARQNSVLPNDCDYTETRWSSFDPYPVNVENMVST